MSIRVKKILMERDGLTADEAQQLIGRIDDKTLREHSSMSAFTFYLDDLTKLRVLQRLKALGLDTAKGSISATIRVCLNEFAASTDDSIKDKIEQEYLLTTKKSKRSTL